jgi:hypothetical protein
MPNEAPEIQPADGDGAPTPLAARILSFRHLSVASAVHSVLFTGLMLCAFVLGKPQPATFVFGLSHGVMYAAMALVAVVAARLRVISVTTALVVAVVGVVCPYFGTYEFYRQDKSREDELAAPDAG